MNERYLHVRFKDGTKGIFQINNQEASYKDFVEAVQDITGMGVQVILYSVK